MALYDRLRSGTVPALLAKFNQGVVEIGRPVTTPGVDPWDIPTTSIVWTRINAVAKGVSQKYIDGVNIVASDREVTCQPTDYQVGDQLRVDGKVVAVLMVDPTPAAGEPVAVVLVVR